jgi:DNA-binding transcriptional LysR family regulator
VDRFDEINAFAAVADARSFTQGAKRLGVSGAQVSKLVARLENRLGARLLNRTTRDVSLTDTGKAYLERARQLIEDFEGLENLVRDEDGCPRGTLKISAPVSFGASQLTPALLDFAARFPELALDVSSTDRTVNLVEEGFDVAVRIGQLADSSLVARRLAAVRMITCASPDYLAKHGAPKALHDLADHEAVLDANMADPNIWSFGKQGDVTNVRVHGRLKFTGAEACVTAARQGFGIIRTPAFACAETCGPAVWSPCSAASSRRPSMSTRSTRTPGTWRPRCGCSSTSWCTAMRASRSGTRAGARSTRSPPGAEVVD